MKIGLLIIDMQKNLLEGQLEQRDIDSASEYINHVANLLRLNHHHVIHIKDVEGSEETSSEMLEFVPEITVEPDDIQMTKEYSNAFWKTELEMVLREKEIGLVVVAGFAAEHCVLFTYNGAIERGFKTAILHKGILSTQNEAIHNTYSERHMISYPVIEFLLHDEDK